MQRDGRLVRGRVASGHEQKPTPHQFQHDGCPAIFAVDRSVQDAHIPVSADHRVCHHQHVRECFGLESIHRSAPYSSATRCSPDPALVDGGGPQAVRWEAR